MSAHEYSIEVINAAGKASPPVAITGVAAAGYDLQSWVLIATLIYTVLQTLALVYKFIKDRKRNGSE